MKNSLRKTGWDYSQDAAYFITVNIIRNEHWLSEVFEGEVHLNHLGKIVEPKWLQIPKIHPNIELGEFIVMPDHFHGIVYFNQPDFDQRSTVAAYEPQRKNLSSIIRGFKSAATISIRVNFPTFKWQRGFHDQILWNQKKIDAFRNYTINNPVVAWEKQKYTRIGEFGVY